MLNGNIPGGQNLAGVGGGGISSNAVSGSSIGGTPIPPTTIQPSSSGLNKNGDSGLKKVIPNPPTKTSTTTTTYIDPAFLASHVKPGAGDMWLTTDDFNSLTTTEQGLYKSTGYDGLTGYWKANNIAYNDQVQAYHAQVQAYYASDPVKTAQQRINELQQEAANDDQLAENGTLNGVYYGDDPAHHSVSPDQKNAYQTEAAKSRATAALLKSYIDAQAPIPPQLAALADPKITPFVTVNSDGTFNVNVIQAAKIGVDTTLLKSVGATDADIAQGNAQRSLVKYAIVGGGFDLNRAVADNVNTTTLKTAYGFSDDAITQAKTYNTVMSVLNKGYKQDTGYLVTQAVADGKLTLAQVNTAGFNITSSDVAQTIKNNAAMKILDSGYKDGSKYEIGQAILDGKITNDQALGLGFQQSDIDESVTAAKANADAKNTNASVSITPSDTGVSTDSIQQEINTAITSKRPNLGNVDALNRAIEDAGYWDNAKLGKRALLGGKLVYTDAKGHILTTQDQVRIIWNSLTADQQTEVAGNYSTDLYRSNPFSETVMQIEEAGQKAGIVGEMAIAPITGILNPIAKATSHQHVTTSDIVNAVLTAVGDTLIVGGALDWGGGMGSPLGENAGRALAGISRTGKIIVDSLTTGMGVVGVTNTIIQAKEGKTAGSTLAVEAALSVFALWGGAGGLISKIVPKGTPNIDVAQQFIDNMRKQTTPEGLSKESPLQSDYHIQGGADKGLTEVTGDLLDEPIAEEHVSSLNKQVTEAADKVDSIENDLKTAKSPTRTFSLQEQLTTANADLSDLKTQLGDAENNLSVARMGKTAYQQSQLTADYRDVVQDSTDYAQNYKDMLTLKDKITDYKATLDKLGSNVTANAESYGIKEMESQLKDLQSKLPELDKTLTESNAKFKASFKSYAEYLKTNEIYRGSEIDVGMKDLPEDPAANIRSTLDQLVHGDNSTEAIAAQQEKVDALQEELTAAKDSLHNISGTEKLEAVEKALAEEQAKLGMMKIGSLSETQSRLLSARQELADIQEIKTNAKNLTPKAIAKMNAIQSQLVGQIDEMEGVMKKQVIQGKGLADTAKVEYLRDGKGNINGARVYTDEGVFKVPVKEVIVKTPTADNPEATTKSYVPQLRAADEITYVKNAKGNLVQTVTPGRFLGEEESTGGGTAVKPALKPITGGGTSSTTTQSTATMTESQLAALRASAGWTFGGSGSATHAVGAPLKTTVPITPTKTGKNPSKNPSELPISPSKIPDFNPKPNTRTITPFVPEESPIQGGKPQGGGKTKPDSGTQHNTGNVPANMAENITGKDNENQNQNMTLSDTQLKVKPKEATKTKVISPTKVQLKNKEEENRGIIKDSLPQKPTEKEIRKAVKKNKGAITWNQGELEGKRRWDVILFPYDQKNDHQIVWGKPPAGAKIVTGAGSAFNTAKVLYGRAPSQELSNISGMGAFRLTISPSGLNGLSLHYQAIADRKAGISQPLKANLGGHGRAFPLRGNK